MKVAVRSVLDAIYFTGGVAGAICLIAILVLIVMQMVARWTGEMFPGAPEYAGYAMAAASFFAFAHALNRGSHIRVSLLLNSVPPGVRRWIDFWCYVVATALAWYFVYFAARFVYWSWKFKDVSQGQDVTLLWIPQSAVLIGSFVLALALTDNMLAILTDGKSRMKSAAIDEPQGE